MSKYITIPGSSFFLRSDFLICSCKKSKKNSCQSSGLSNILFKFLSALSIDPSDNCSIVIHASKMFSFLFMYKCQDKYVHFRLFKNVQFGSEIRYQLCSFNRLLNLGLVILLNVIF